MSKFEQTPSEPVLESPENELSLTKQELADFRKLPKEVRDKQNDDKFISLQALHEKLHQAVQEAIRTGDTTKTRSLKVQLESEINDLMEKNFELIMEVIPDPSITSRESAIRSLEARGYTINDNAKSLFSDVDWSEKLQDSYEIVVVTVGELFNDEESHIFVDIESKAKEQGLVLVPASLVPSIREQYPENGIGTIVATKVINGMNGPGFFNCHRAKRQALIGVNKGEDNILRNHLQRFFFARQR
jgi:hypothetical protein